MLGRIFISALIAAVIILMLWGLRGLMLAPLKRGRHTLLTLTLRVTGPEPRLEETLDGVLWLRENGNLPADIIIEDAGMDEETRQVARLAARNRDCISLRLKEDI
ncbi:MAG TPA: hypothetical protein DC001_05590 [Clostridiales bacterium]|nr:hypothetical protein [Clostridiales bacterium]HBR08275.1 hypothetical protein [Clostridiales bacterium]